MQLFILAISLKIRFANMHLVHNLPGTKNLTYR